MFTYLSNLANGGPQTSLNLVVYQGSHGVTDCDILLPAASAMETSSTFRNCIASAYCTDQLFRLEQEARPI